MTMTMIFSIFFACLAMGHVYLLVERAYDSEAPTEAIKALEIELFTDAAIFVYAWLAWNHF